LTGHAFAKRIKMYTRWAGIGDVHLHQTRHTFARWVSESTGSTIETQDALGHRHAATTTVYVQRVAVKKDGHSTSILDRLDVYLPDRGSSRTVSASQAYRRKRTFTQAAFIWALPGRDKHTVHPQAISM